MLDAMNIFILIASSIIVIAVFTSLIASRLGAPLLLVFLFLGVALGEDGVGIEFDNAALAYFIGSLALAVILFDSGFETRRQTLRVALAPALVLATVGVLLTAGITGVAAQHLFQLETLEALLLGAIVASTDAAAVFFLLRVGGINLRDRVRSTLELESGTNDPIAVLLTITLVELIAEGATTDEALIMMVVRFVVQMGLGLLLGLAGGFAIVAIVNRVRLDNALYPIVVLGLALALYGLTSVLGGSGLLAVFVAGLVSGNAKLRQTVALRRFNSAMTWLAQIVMFVTLGLLATPAQFVDVAVPALLLALFLIVIARPLAVTICLLPFPFTRNEIAFASWVGLRGAVSILLGIVPLIGQLPGAQTLFNAAFIVVVVSLVVQGWTIGPLARRLGLIVPPRFGPVERFELELPGGAYEVVAYTVHPDSAVAHGKTIPRWARPSLIVRDGRSLKPHMAGKAQAGDQLYVLTTDDRVPVLDKLFAPLAAAGDDPDIYGDFPLSPEAKLAELGAAYGFSPVTADRDLTVRELLEREFGADVEAGDRLTYGSVDLIVRAVDEEHHVEEAGLAVAPAPLPPRIGRLIGKSRFLAMLDRATRSRTGPSR
jgi:cell volume regulation protein A